MDQKTVRVPLPLVQAVVNYLAARPWAETNDMIVALSRLPQEGADAEPAEAPAKKRVKAPPAEVAP